MPRDGRLPEPLREGVVPPTADELSAWTGAPARRGGHRGAGRGRWTVARRGVLPPHLGRALGRRARHRGRLAAPDQDGAAGPRRGQRLDPARPRPGPAEIAARSSACSGGSAGWRGVGGHGSVHGTRRRSSAPTRPPSHRARRVRARRRPATAARPLRRLDPARRRLERTGDSRRSSPGSACPTRTSIRRTNGCRRSTSRWAWTRLSSSSAGSAGWRTRNAGGPSAAGLCEPARAGARRRRARPLRPVRQDRHAGRRGLVHVPEQRATARPLAPPARGAAWARSRGRRS